VVRVDPLDGVGLAQATGLAFGEDEGAVLGGVDAVEGDGARGEVRQDRAVAAEDDDVVILLQR
jgi:hypothetical protein